MNAPRPNDDEFVREVEKLAARRKDARGGGVWRGLAQVGTVGWMVALPAVGGAFLGRWIDGEYRTGVFWTLSLLTIGLMTGCVATWRAMNREVQ